MRILLVEDRGSVLYPMRDALEDLHYAVIHAWNVREAQAALQQGGLDCIIADLNVPPDGLSPEQIAQTRLGKLAGWIWLESAQLVGAQTDVTAPKVIVYTGYLDTWRLHYKESDYPDVVFIRKAPGGAEAVMRHVKEAASKLEHAS